jgi:hypothetical protein
MTIAIDSTDTEVASRCDLVLPGTSGHGGYLIPGMGTDCPSDDSATPMTFDEGTYLLLSEFYAGEDVPASACSDTTVTIEDSDEVVVMPPLTSCD